MPVVSSCFYEAVQNVYGVFAYIFLVCWIVQSMLAAAIFEWFLVLCSVAMQWFGIRRGALGCTREIEDNKFHIFAGRHSVAILSVYVFVNLLSVIVFTPPLLYFGIESEAHSLRDDAAVSTGPEFWCIVLVSVGTVFLSKSVSRLRVVPIRTTPV
jgi:hypothetical protein